jgi:hypothetical protein
MVMERWELCIVYTSELFYNYSNIVGNPKGVRVLLLTPEESRDVNPQLFLYGDDFLRTSKDDQKERVKSMASAVVGEWRADKNNYREAELIIVKMLAEGWEPIQSDGLHSVVLRRLHNRTSSSKDDQ